MKGVFLSPNDNLAIANGRTSAGGALPGGASEGVDIEPGHKVAICSIEAYASVVKYGQVIGRAFAAIEPGQHVHSHNLAFDKSTRLDATACEPVVATEIDRKRTFMGFWRGAGRAGTRNYVGIIASVNCSSTVCRMVVGYARHPNFAGVLMIGLGCEVNQLILYGQKGTAEGRRHFNIHDVGGSRRAVELAVSALGELTEELGDFTREPIPVSELVPGGSRPTPSVQLASNSLLYRSMEEDMDIDCGVVASGEKSIREMGGKSSNCLSRPHPARSRRANSSATVTASSCGGTSAPRSDLKPNTRRKHMLFGIDPLLSPDLLHALRTMGHGDEIVIADANFPASTLGPKVIRCDGIGGEALLGAILAHLPLDTFVEVSAFRMAVVDKPDEVPSICSSYARIVRELAGPFSVQPLERFEFYKRARDASYIVASGERAFYGNIILKKGVVPAPERPQDQAA
jgi:L-fucose mutarotase/ribose pyranase (RbsD/FucU family)